MAKQSRIIARVALAACLLLACVPAVPAPVAHAASAPSYNCKLTQKNMLKLVRAYDSDAYYILETQDQAGDDFSEWMNGSKRLVDAVDTTVHEEFHGYTHTYGDSLAYADGTWHRYEYFYLGNKKTNRVVVTDVFKTAEAASKIPKRYRTFRYDTYVSNSSGVSANLEGVYGMLNEFSAYYWGMHASESLYPYIKKHVSSAEGYWEFISSFTNNRDAYAEFYYWTLVYLDYARQHKPEVYKEILANDSYTKTFKTMRSKYQKLIKAYKKDLDKVCKKFNHGAGFSKSYNKKTGTLKLGGLRLIWGRAAYDLLAGQISSAKYAKVRKALLG